MPFVHTSKAVFLHNSLIWVGNLTKTSFPEILCSGLPREWQLQVTAELGLGWKKEQKQTDTILVSCNKQK